MKRWLVAVSVVLLAVGGALSLFLSGYWSSRPGITRANFDRLEPGMSRAQVEAILGGPPGEYVTWHGPEPYLPVPWGIHYHQYEFWTGDECEVAVLFDASGRLSDKDIGGELYKEPTMLENLLGWLWPKVGSR
jgi:hypothetical protein